MSFMALKWGLPLPFCATSGMPQLETHEFTTLPHQGYTVLSSALQKTLLTVPSLHL